MNKSKLTRSQYTTYTKQLNKNEVFTITARYDDQYENGHNTFSLTAELKNTRRRENNIIACGYLHDEIAEHFPELAPFLKWHLTSSDGPPHYIVDTMYQASDKDCWGLRKGEKKQILTDGVVHKVPIWRGVIYDGKGNEIDLGSGYGINSDTKPADNGDIKYVPWYKIGKGKTPDLEAARSCAVWPNASLEDLQSKEKLLARLPKLLEEFRADMESLGFTY